LCPFPWGVGSHRTQCYLGRGLPPYQVVSWCIQPFGHNTHGPKSGRGAVPLSGGSWVSVLDNVASAEAYLRRTKSHLDPSSHGHNRHKPNSGGGLLCPLFGVGLLPCGGAGSPSETMWRGPRRHTKWYVDPSNSLATIHHRHRHTGQTDNGPIP